MRILISLLFLSMISLAISCKSDRPENVIDQASMTAILMDFYLAESNMTALRLERDSAEKIFKTYEKVLFNRHQVDSSTYYTSLTYYYDHPDYLDKIYETILDSLTLRESKMKANENAAKDSVKNIKPSKKR